MGELLFEVSGITSKLENLENGDDEEMAEAVVDESSRRALNSECRDRILLALYLTRQDTVNSQRFGLVRQSSMIHITLLARSLEGRNCPTFSMSRDVTW